MEALRYFFNKKKILITGHTGFKGIWLTSLLLNFGSKLIGYSQKDEKINQYKKIVNYKKVTNVFDDILNFNHLKKVVNTHKPEIIFHLAAQSLVIESYKKPYKTFLENTNGVLNILEITRNSKFVKSLIIATSDKCYKVNNTKKKFKESDELGGVDPYSASKATAEIIFYSYKNLNFKNKKIGIATVRAGNVIGGGDFSKNRIIPDCFRSLKKRSLIIRNPEAVRPWQHVIDVIRGYLILSKKLYNESNRFSGSWNFGPEKNEATVLSLVKNFKKYSKAKFQIKIKKNKKYKETKVLKLSSLKAAKKLKWKNLIKINQAIKLTVDWYNDFLRTKSGNKVTLNQLRSFF